MSWSYLLTVVGLAFVGHLCRGYASSEEKEIVAKLNAIRGFIQEKTDQAEHYTKDAVILPAGQPPVVGRDDIAKYLHRIYEEDTMTDLVYDEDPKVQVLSDGTTAYSWQKFSIFNREGKVAYTGKSVVIWRKDPVTKEWLGALEIYNEGH